MSSETVLEIKNLETHFKTDAGLVKAVDGVSLSLKKGEVLGLVGESGSGKSVSSLSVMRLIPSPPGKIAGGQVFYQEKDLLQLPESEMRLLRGDRIAMIFQDPMTALNPFLRISTQLIETIRLHQKLDKPAAFEKAVEMLELVGIPAARRRIRSYPHQFSGGMRQRVMIAIALCCKPEILIADEPTTALDVTIQAQILDLLKDLCQRLGTSILFITHDLGVVANMCDRVCVMYAGRIVEEAPVETLYKTPAHPYSIGLINSVPHIEQDKAEKLYSIKGSPPHLIDMPPCCPFHPRCDRAIPQCSRERPPLRQVGPQHFAACWNSPLKASHA